MNPIHHSMLTAGLVGLILATVAGCADMQRRQDAFFPANEARSVDAIAQAQMDNGAAKDGMLRAVHFDGDALNRLGCDKLDAMIRSSASSSLTVYLDLPASDAAHAARHDAVIAYLNQQGLAGDQYAVKDGINPATLSSADENLVRLPKTEGGVAVTGAGASGSSAPLFTNP